MLFKVTSVLLYVSLVYGQCIPKDFGYGSTVCVCNETYCDTIPDVPLEDMNLESYHLYTTTQDGQRFNLTSHLFSEFFNIDSDVDLTPFANIQFQEILGFGGAFTDSAVINIRSLPKKAQEQLIYSYFHPSQLKYTLGRVPIAATDFSTHPYSYDPQPDDFSLSQFALTDEDINGKIPLIKKAEEVAGTKIKLVAAAWGAPEWMKVDNKILSVCKIRRAAFKAFARYHVRFLEEYEKQGVTFCAISQGNNPGTNDVASYFSPSDLHTWVAYYLGPVIKKNFPSVKIMFLDDYISFIKTYYPVMDDRVSGPYLDGWAVHGYGDLSDFAPNLQFAHKRYPDKPILFTEYSFILGNVTEVPLGSWDKAEDYATRIITGLNNWGTGWIDWNLVLDKSGGPSFFDDSLDSPIIVDGDQFYKQPKFYVVGHFSKFFEPGSKIIDVQLRPSHVIEVAAALNPNNSLAIVLFNKKKRPISVAVKVNEKRAANIILPQNSISTLVCLIEK